MMTDMLHTKVLKISLLMLCAILQYVPAAYSQTQAEKPSPVVGLLDDYNQ